jgi:hypothetical protein
MSTGKKTFNEPDYYQPAVVYNATIRVGFHKERIAYPFYSPSVFYTEEDATKFLVIFIKSLLKSGDLPPDAVNADGTINEKIIRTVIYPIIVTELELDAD